METTLDKFGRVVIPKHIRDGLGLHPGSVLEIKEEDRGIFLTQVQEEPRVVMKKGVLVFSGVGVGDIKGAIRSHRNERLNQEVYKVNHEGSI